MIMLRLFLDDLGIDVRNESNVARIEKSLLLIQKRKGIDQIFHFFTKYN